MLVYSKLVGISGLVIGLDLELNLPKWGSETCKTNSKSKTSKFTVSGLLKDSPHIGVIFKGKSEPELE